MSHRLNLPKPDSETRPLLATAEKNSNLIGHMRLLVHKIRQFSPSGLKTRKDIHNLHKAIRKAEKRADKADAKQRNAESIRDDYRKIANKLTFLGWSYDDVLSSHPCNWPPSLNQQLTQIMNKHFDDAMAYRYQAKLKDDEAKDAKWEVTIEEKKIAEIQSQIDEKQDTSDETPKPYRNPVFDE